MSNNKHNIKATILDKRGRILAVGYNSYEKTSPVQAQYGKRVNQPARIYLHAEIAALVKVKHGVPHKIKIERYNRFGEPKMAAPCPICSLAIKESGIKFIEYTVG